ncbi:GNAT family acetyltransferase [Rhodotorula taiwanensis]|uniref:GNAT family acetyltransferase n=1 Tax=Rhodotorula taiwanensis TaxID=741276 RepID=A0A2S5AZL4_9BASI|nr:GNAT family acetyltransferase [Rhodotorula taiwanensis]
MAISIQPATRDDIEALSRLQLDAMSSDYAWRQIFRDADADDNLRLAIKQNLDMLTRSGRSLTRAIRGQDDEPIAMALDALYDAANDEPGPEPELPAGANTRLAEAFFPIFDDCLKYAKERDGRFYHLTVLAVAPRVQRSGAGKALLQAFVDKADAANLPCYLESTEAGQGLYAKYGFVPYRGVARCTLDEEMSVLPMRRPAKSEVGAK